MIGGYQAVKKRLSYREEDILGRPLTKDEAREVTAMVRRLTVLILLSTACRDETLRTRWHPARGGFLRSLRSSFTAASPYPVEQI